MDKADYSEAGSSQEQEEVRWPLTGEEEELINEAVTTQSLSL